MAEAAFGIWSGTRWLAHPADPQRDTLARDKDKKSPRRLAEPAYVRGARVLCGQLRPLHQEVLTQAHGGRHHEQPAGERERVHPAEGFHKTNLDVLPAAQAECPCGHHDGDAGARSVAEHERWTLAQDQQEGTEGRVEGGRYGCPVGLTDLWGKRAGAWVSWLNAGAQQNARMFGTGRTQDSRIGQPVGTTRESEMEYAGVLPSPECIGVRQLSPGLFFAPTPRHTSTPAPTTKPHQPMLRLDAGSKDKENMPPCHASD